MKQTGICSLVIFLFLTSCTALRQAGTGNNKPVATTQQKSTEPDELKFLDIDVAVEKPAVKNSKQPVNTSDNGSSESVPAFRYTGTASSELEAASQLQIKYAILLNTEVEEIRSLKIFEFIDDWYGTRYCMGGTTKTCIDCSAFVQLFFTAIYGAAIPRTARDQYRAAQKISRTEIKEGDLLFFNTRGGVSHVGIYLQNNKFVHASTSGGVMISDMFEPYWVKRLIGVGRMNKELLAGAQ